jgi:hypothetical protein
MAELTNLESKLGSASTDERERGHAGVQELAAWALSIQQRHLEGARTGSKTLAANEDPNETASSR